MELKEIINRNYAATVRRGKIIKSTDSYEFIEKIKEEINECEEIINDNNFPDPLEIADIIIVALNFAKHYNIDIEKTIEEKTIINEKRLD
jgi:NTP pyrophosphatase (non-canonical NTP hydrolase)